MEWRSKSGLQSMFLYALSTVFLVYWSIHKMGGEVWVAVYWLMVVFSAFNSVGRGFLQESPSEQFYYYGISSPMAILWAKMVYNVMVMWALNLALLFFYALTLGFPILQIPYFFFSVFLGILALSTSLTFLSAMASKASGNSGLLAILGIPVLLPILFLAVHFSVGTLNPQYSQFGKDIVALILINFIVPSVATLVFPYIWRH